MIITAKLVSIVLGLALTAFVVSTIVLAVQKTQLQNDLEDARNKVDELEDAMKTTTTTSGPLTSESPETTTGNPEEPEVIDYRLPNTLYPTHYDLYLHPEISTGNFSGQELITIKVDNSTKEIVLHAHNLAIEHVWLEGVNSGTIFVEGYHLDTIREFLIIHTSEEIGANTTFRLGIVFSGSMTNKIVGLYMSSYLKSDQTRKYIATSKFEPTYARQAFPCFDEPAMKATFEIVLVHPNGEGYHALSNMDIMQEKNQGQYVEVYFTKSVPMSTYLACFIVSDFTYEAVEVDTKGIGEPFEMRVFATPEQIDKVKFALEVGKSVIEYYIEYFRIEYPLPKLDMAAIPDFVSGAMEHWGLVTYRETALLYDEKESSTANKQRVTSVIAHEFAHMWFGNLVTMMWWNDLWLNEGFARYIENKGVDSKFPEWKMQDQFITATLHDVLSLDATLGSHPIVQTVKTPDQITEIFDTITYSKGASVIRMLEDFLTEANFRQAVTNYLNNYKYKNAVTDDFLRECNQLGLGIDVAAIMDTWTVQRGLPVVNVERVSSTQLKLTQKRFLSNPDDYEVVDEPSPYNYTWSIPITYRTNENSQVQREWFYHDQSEINIMLPANVQWIKFNADQMGYYRVNYPHEMWEDLAATLIRDPKVLSVGDRASVLNDAFSLADATQLAYDVPLDLMQYLEDGETDYVPWSVAASKLTSLNHKLMFGDNFVNYNNYGTKLISSIYKTVGWNVDADPAQHLQNRLRVSILNAACSLGLPQCMAEAATLFNKWLQNPAERPAADVREIVYFYGMMRAGDKETWDKVWELFLRENDASEKSKLMYGLSGIQVPWILKQFIDMAWDENNVRGQDYFTCLQNIAANTVGESIVWEYVRENWQNLVDRFGLNERYLGNMIPAITARFSTQTRLEEMEQFFMKYPEGGAGTAARVRALENVKNNIAWLKNNRESIGDWLQQHKY